MTISTRTVLDRREILANGIIQVRLAKQIVNGDQILASEWHRFALSPGDDVDAAISLVNAHLTTMDFPAISDADATAIKNTAAQEWS